MAHTFKKRGKTKYSDVSNLLYYTVSNPFDVNSASGGNCTWYAWGRFWEVWASVETKYKTKRPTPVSKSNACYFYSDAKKNGYQVGLTPKPGAIICWGYNGSPHGNPGHVAFVEKVNKDGSIEISHSGWSSGPMENETLKRGNGQAGTSAYHRGYSNDYFNGFIYNPIDFGNPAGNISGKSKEWYISQYGLGAEVYFELASYGYSHKACCAVLGNMQQESGIRLKTGGSYDGNGSEGLCQWTFVRKDAMQEYAKEHSAKKTWVSVDGQVAYLVYELEHSEKKANEVLKTNNYTLDKMTEEFEKAFERAGVPMMEKRIRYANEWDKKMSGAYSAISDPFGGESSESFIDMARRASKLYSSDNYDYIEKKEEEESEVQKTRKNLFDNIKKYISDIHFEPDTNMTSAVPERLIGSGPLDYKKEPIKKTKATFDISKALVQAPFIELTIGNYTIGSYKGSIDKYPNYISKMDIKKINGEINQYTIALIHQIRPGEDPNLIDKLLSKVRYNKISIRYGDCESGSLFKDTEAIITNVVNNRDYASSRITYTIYATSACNYVTSIKFDFKAVEDKPSNVIHDLLYNNTNTSALLLDVFPGMRDMQTVYSKGLIPNNDAVLKIDAKSNIDVLSYINFLVGCMSNVANDVFDIAYNVTRGITNTANTIVNGITNIVSSSTNTADTDTTYIARNIEMGATNTAYTAYNGIIRLSSYFITYSDDVETGAYFKINEVKSSSTKKSVLTNNVFEITVGFPDGNDVYDFKVNNTEVWSLLYKNRSVSGEYFYDIDSNGDTDAYFSPNLFSSSRILNEIQKNWWTQMVTFPISAQLTMRGLLKPVSLMDYIQINVVFYGQKHITSGLYVITGEQDVLSGSGFLTNLSLLRVGD